MSPEATASSFYERNGIEIMNQNPLVPQKFNWNVTINYLNHKSYSDFLIGFSSDNIPSVASYMIEYPDDVVAILIVRQ